MSHQKMAEALPAPARVQSDAPQAQAQGLVVTVPNEVLDQRVRDAEASALPPIILTDLAQHCLNLISQAQQAKADIELDLVKDLEQRAGKYDASTLALIADEGGTDIYDNVTETKCAAGEAWIADVLMMTRDDRPFGCNPTPLPELPPEVQGAIVGAVMQRVAATYQQTGQIPSPDVVFAATVERRDMLIKLLQRENVDRAERMEAVIADQLIEGGFRDILEDVLSDFVTFKACVVKGPIIERTDGLDWQFDPKTGSSTPIKNKRLKYRFRRVSPFDFYPGAAVSTLDSGPCAERIRLQPSELADMRGTPGFDDAAIEKVLAEYGMGGLRTWSPIDARRYQLEHQDDASALQQVKDSIEMWEVWDCISGTVMRSYGASNAEFKDGEYYHVSVRMVGNDVISATMSPSLMGNKPYKMSSYRKIPGTLWGRGVPELMRDRQRAINAASRAAVNNMVAISAPQTEVDVSRLIPGEPITTFTPGRVWQTDGKGSGSPAVRFYLPPVVMGQLWEIRDRESRAADDDTGIPPYTYGADDVAGAGATFRGLRLLMQSAARGLRKAILNLDKGLIRPIVKDLWYMNMLYHPDQRIKGDIEVVPRGALELFVRQEETERTTTLLQATSNPIDQAIIGPQGRAEQLRQVFKGNKLDPDGIVPSEEEIAQRAAMAAAAAQESQGGSPAAPGNAGQ